MAPSVLTLLLSPYLCLKRINCSTCESIASTALLDPLLNVSLHNYHTLTSLCHLYSLLFLISLHYQKHQSLVALVAPSEQRNLAIFYHYPVLWIAFRFLVSETSFYFSHAQFYPCLLFYHLQYDCQLLLHLSVTRLLRGLQLMFYSSFLYLSLVFHFN